tara:strand:+ start:134 stop:715 length:582 start_codon:yes stop_codon:yes gene_type:complete
MIKSKVNIIDFNILYNTLLEIKDHLNFDIINHKNESDFVKNIDTDVNKDYIIITKIPLKNSAINQKNVILLEKFPLNFFSLIDLINSSLLKQKYNFQSNFTVKDYKLDLNSRIIIKKENSLKLTEKEIDIILFLKDKKEPQNINILQKEVWGYSKDLETHTVETHIYRLRKKIGDKFKDENFILSEKEGYLIK